MNIKPQQMEIFAASQFAERLGKSDRLMEKILDRKNIIRAWNMPEKYFLEKGLYLPGN